MAELLKDIYDKQFFDAFSERCLATDPGFDAKKFAKWVFSKDWQQKELKERMRHITLALSQVLPTSFPQSAKFLVSISESIDTGGFEYMFLPDFIEVFGQNHWRESVEAIEKITPIASGEFAVRAFILKDPKRMIKTMVQWSKSKNYHVRRLASEGSRPRLPWAVALPEFKKDPSKVLTILENLKCDPELYVRRSVANNLNDISKDNPTFVIDLLKSWSVDQSDEMKWLVRHSLRTLEKQGNKKALRLLGYSTRLAFNKADFQIKPKKIKMGQKIELKLGLRANSKKSHNIVIDYVIYHKKANGSLAPKVFKWSKTKLDPKKDLHLKKVHHIKQITTRKYYSGVHEIHVQVNGKIVAQDKFTLKVD